MQKVFQNFEKSCPVNPGQKTSECVFNKVAGVDFRIATFLKKAFQLIVYKKTEERYIELQRVTTNDSE